MTKKVTSIFKHAFAITIVSFVVVAAGTLGYILWQTNQHRAMVEKAREERQQMSERIWNAKSENFKNAVRDNSAWDDLVDFTEKHSKQPDDSAWLEDNFGYMLDSYTASMVAIFDMKGERLYSKIAEGYENFDFFSMDFVFFSKKFKETGLIDFYMYEDSVLMEFFGASITSSADNDHTASPKGFLLLSREIDDEVINDYRVSVGALKAEIINTQDAPAHDDINIVISTNFNNYKNGHEAVMRSVFENSVEKFFDDMKPAFGLFALLCVIAMANIIVFMRNNMMSPLSKISDSLSESDPTVISDLATKKNEFGQIAEMLQEFFMQQEEVKMQNETLVLQSEEIRCINDDLSNQKNQLAEVNRQLTDSIEYAGRIQRSAVTPMETITAMFHDSMVIYLPRNIVSGDWYYMAQHSGKKVVIEADCTGHGVPGSLLSMLGINAVKDILKTMEINGEQILPEIVLDRMRMTIKTTLIKQTDDTMSMSDGMDMSIAVIEPDHSKMRFAGANQSLFIMRNTEITKLKGNRMPIGDYVRETPFEGIDFALQRGDAIFFMSDGIKDQISPEMEKFKWMRLEAFLIEHSTLPMPLLGTKLVQTITKWQGDMEQVDDMTMIGFRV